MRRPHLVALGIVLAVTTVAVPPAVADAGGRAGTRWTALHATTTSDGPLVQHPPTCDATGQCVGSYTSLNTVSGDLTGTVAVEGVVQFVAGNTTVRQANLQLFTVAVAGCGSGTFTVELPFQPISLVEPSASAAVIVEGSGTGDLAGIRGRASATFTPSPQGGGTGGYTFKIRCTAR
jgi:hypothetical protein